MAGRTVTGVMGRHRRDGPSQTLGKNLVSELCDDSAGRTVAGTMARHRLRNPRLGRISVKCFKGRFGLFLLIIIKLVVEY